MLVLSDHPPQKLAAMICTDDEIVSITRRKRPTAQARVLAAMGIEHLVRPDRTLVVSRARIEHLLGGPKPAKVKKIEPNWGALAQISKT